MKDEMLGLIDGILCIYDLATGTVKMVDERHGGGSVTMDATSYAGRWTWCPVRETFNDAKRACVRSVSRAAETIAPEDVFEVTFPKHMGGEHVFVPAGTTPVFADIYSKRANEIADRCGDLENDLDEANRTIGRLTRENERLIAKLGKSRGR